ncbi:MAG: flavodoxin-dependent (E)-4-hydroxy-3-methylbut-2-enyl-diphosphate synthase [Planctomycetes bacterium]|nr:flavodoxin-dependent (E)-4-hydroxy-3-methylbut-2-enyl-diphosphate synthase [Planctomycetota bacterium]
MQRRKTREVAVGRVGVGGENPVRVQSMCSSHTWDVPKTLDQIRRLQDLDCEMVRVTVPDQRDLDALPVLKKSMRAPLIADIHFNYRMALGAAEVADKVRINPGNIGGYDRLKEVVKKCKDRGVAMRIGVNAGSLEKEFLDKYGWPTPEALVESAVRHVEYCESLGYRNMVVSLKSSDVQTAIQSYRLFSKACDYPIHLGITEAGMGQYAMIKSAVGIGNLLLEGIGDTLRVSIVGDPSIEVPVAWDILKCTGARIRDPEIVACPTCGRIEIDLESLVLEIQKRLKGNRLPVKISVLGCVVNGPGEAREADIGIAGGKGVAYLYRRGQQVRRVQEHEIVEAVLAELQNWDEKGNFIGDGKDVVPADPAGGVKPLFPILKS